MPFPFSVDSVKTNEVKIRDEQKNMLQPWHVSNEIDISLLHDKKTGFDAFLFERDVDGKKQVVVFRGRDIR
ncbi:MULTISPECIES: hypothetical protein [Bacillus]|uniref:hypothetical protein n=1 Tax=Bacillus TaxID=1386 RepID=UPI0011143796|nr:MULTISPECIES: hypothetical protein [Bacillus]KAB2483777.1 hypothetical protein F8157_19890 [Bacillus cereus]MCU4956366.1 hypothetical protein [Bacillus cereus]MED2917864.1 hypothetical protein [Bacillus thuringiensis]MED3049073.1 hypothetical protein [Bacillus thuringiensis]MED3053130.1 hypothetical protein [Bacillus thuringiensis]